MNQKEVLAFPSPSKRGGVCISNEYEGIWKEEEMKDEELAISFEKEKRKRKKKKKKKTFAILSCL